MKGLTTSSTKRANCATFERIASAVERDRITPLSAAALTHSQNTSPIAPIWPKADSKY